jgi:small basic protein
MWLLGLGLVVGVVLGLNVPWQVPSILARYLAIGLLAGVDTSLGGLRAALDGDFDIVIFVTGFLGNVILAAVFVYVGDILGIELYLAAVVVLGIRIFNNFGFVRRHLVKNLLEKETDS